MQPLEPAQRRALRAKAHHLDPVVTIGHHGLTPAVLHEIDVALTAHQLVKVRAASDDRETREALVGRICGELDCAPVQQIGKLLVLWRPAPAEDAAELPPPRKRPATSGKRRPGTGQEAPAAPRPSAAEVRGTRPAPGKAPKGVPRAAMPRRRRGV